VAAVLRYGQRRPRLAAPTQETPRLALFLQAKAISNAMATQSWKYTAQKMYLRFVRLMIGCQDSQNITRERMGICCRNLVFSLLSALSSLTKELHGFSSLLKTTVG
jgi:hypothetical protein